MPVIINIPTGDVSYTYPPEIQEQIRLYQMRGFEELYSAFLILDAVYKSKYKIAPRPYWSWCEPGSEKWEYRITSPLLNQRIYIKEGPKDLTPNVPRTEAKPWHDFTTEYQLNIGNLFEMSGSDGLIPYMCRLFAEPAKQKYLANNNDRYREMEQRRRSNLITLANDITNMQH